MSYFTDVYLKRVNRYGNDYQSRVQGKREENFEYYLLKSVYRVDIDYDNEIIPATFEKYKQDETETLHYLLTRTNVNIPAGTILFIPNKDNELKPWMVYWLESINASGYNRYTMLRMTHYLTWFDNDNIKQESWAYMYGQEDNMLKDEIRSRSRMDTIYRENLKMSFFVMPTNPKVKKENYFIIGEGELTEYYRVTGYDIQSTPGVEYVTVDPTFEYDLTPFPEKTPEDNEDEYFWDNGGLE